MRPSILKKPENRILLDLVMVLMMQSWLVAVAVRNMQSDRKARAWFNHLFSLILEIEDFHASLGSSEADIAAFLYTGDPLFQEGYRHQLSEMDAHFKVARVLAEAIPEGMSSLDLIADLVQQRLDHHRSVIGTFENNGLEPAIEQLRQTASQVPLSGIQQAVSNLRLRLNDLQFEKEQQLYRLSLSRRNSLIAGTVFNAVLLALLFGLSRREFSIRRKMIGLLRRSTRLLEKKVRRRTNELTEANQKLKEEVIETKWAQSSMERSLKLYQHVADSISEAVFISGPHAKIMRINQVVCTLSGLDRRAIVGKPLEEVLSLSSQISSDKEPAVKSIGALCQLKKPRAGIKMEFKKQGGGTISGTCKVVPVIKGNDRISTFLIFTPSV